MTPFSSNKPSPINWQDIRAFLDFMQRRIEHARLQQVAGNLTFTTLLALVPLLTIALALFTTFPLFGTLRSSLEAYFIQIMMPRSIANTILGYLTIFTEKAAHLSIIGALGVLVGSVALMGMIERSFNQIWRIRKTRPWLQRSMLYLTTATLGPFTLAVSLSMTSYLYMATGGSFRNPSFLYSTLSTLLSIFWTTTAFTVLYVLIPNRTIPWREAIWGGLFAAVALEVVKRVFAAFIIQFPAYRTIYGAMAAIPIFLLWIYLSWLITLTGAALVAAIHYMWHGRWRHVPVQGSTFLDAVEILRILHRAGEHGIDEGSLRAITGFGLDEIENLLQRMQEAGWVQHMKPGTRERIKERKIRAMNTASWKLAADPAVLTLADVFQLFAFTASGVSPLARHVQQVMHQGLNESLTQHFTQPESAGVPQNPAAS